MASDEMQVHLTAKDDLTRELKNTIKNVAKLEAQLKDLDNATSPDAARDVEKLSRQLDRAYDKSKTLSSATDVLDEKLDQMGYSAKVAGERTDALGRDMDQTRRKGAGMAAGWGKIAGAAAAVTGAIAATAGAFRFLSDSIDEARQARKAMAQTAAVMRSMGRTEAPKRIERMVDNLESISGIDGDNIREMTNVLLTFGEVTDGTFVKANKLALDLSVAYGKDLNSAAVMVGKALNDPLKGLTALSRVGVQFTKQQSDQIKAMMDVNDVAGAQKIIVAELTKQVGGSAAAQADGIAKTQVAWGNLKEAIGEALLSSAPGWDLTSKLEGVTKWIQQHQGEIVEGLLTIAGAAMRIGQAFLKMGALVTFSWGQILLQMVPVLKVVGIFIPKADQMATSLTNSALSAINASEAMNETADSLGSMSDQAFTARDRVKQLNDQLKQIKDKKVRIDVRTTLTDVFSAVDAAVDKANGGDTTVGMGVGSLGAAGLAAYHGAVSSALGGHSILSGVRGSNLGSVHSDHRYGRAMDVQGPRLGAYAQVVRRNGGYAAMHGAGANRHLHVVPQTRRPQPVAAGGHTFHADVVVNNPRTDMDIEAAVARGLRAAARQTRERG